MTGAFTTIETGESAGRGISHAAGILISLGGEANVTGEGSHLRLRSIPALLVSVAFLAASGCRWCADAVWLKQEDSGRTVSVSRDGLVHIELEETGSTGYQWIIEDLESTGCLRLVETQLKHSGIRSILGAPSVRVWKFKAAGEGCSQLKIHYKHPWELKEKAAETFQVRVNCS